MINEANQMAEIKTTGEGTVKLGRQCSIGQNVNIIFSRPAVVEIGDYAALGDGVKIIVDGGNVSIGDWTTLHSDTLVLSKTGVNIGQHCWFGQNTVLDGTGGLTIEDGVRVGMYSQLWSHVAAGEQIEGCTLYGENPIHIGANVWLVGSCMVASGVTIGERTIALAGSNVTKNAAANVVLAGSPAKPKEGLSFYREVTLDEKFDMLRGWLVDFIGPHVMDGPSLSFGNNTITLHGSDTEKVIFFKNAADYDAAPASEKTNTLCCIENKRYIKTFSPLERSVLKYLGGNKARFYS